MAQGNITKRVRKDGTPAYRVRYDISSPDGARSQVSETVATKREAQHLLTRRLEQLRTGDYAVPTTLTVADYLAQWLDTLPGSGTSPTRQYSCQQLVRLYMEPELGRHRLSSLTTLHVQRAVSTHVERGLAPATVRNIYSTLSTALSQAVTWRLVPRNVATGIKLPRAVRRPPTVWSTEQVRTFLAATAGHPLHPMWRLALDSGMRPGELLALRWGDMDLDALHVTVARTMTKSATGAYVVGTGTKGGRSRRVALAPATVATLRAHRASMATIDPAALVFSRRGRPYWHHEAGAALHAESDAAGLPRIRMHDLRHTNATILIAAGVPITVVAERLGHARVSMTLDRYAHVLEGMQERAAETISRLFDGPRDHDVTTASDVMRKSP